MGGGGELHEGNGLSGMRQRVEALGEDAAANPGAGMTVRVVIAEDQAMVRGALAALLAIGGGIEVVGQAQNGREAVELVAKLVPDVLLTDIEMPELTGLEVAAEIRRRKLPVKVAILTTFA